MCYNCYDYENDYLDREWVLGEAVVEIADLHMADWNLPRIAEGQALCNACGQWWPCITFMAAAGALNDVR